jgi:hypothetical protein
MGQRPNRVLAMPARHRAKLIQNAPLVCPPCGSIAVYHRRPDLAHARRRCLMRVPFSEVLRPKPSRSRALQAQRRQLIGSCQHELTRCKRLKAEICEELGKMEATSSAIRASLARLQKAPNQGAYLAPVATLD